ncbi:MAG: tRNA adenosine(34) deaminase TadA [Lachnospiraceae bacterium]|nr:tRNA adenosine(34) deaminase TadA [Lachnospiraceae bacterium]
MAKDRLLGELIGLSKAVCGSIDEERFAPDADCHQVVLESLAAVAEEIAAEKATIRKNAKLTESGQGGSDQTEAGSEQSRPAGAIKKRYGVLLKKLSALAEQVIAEKWQRVPTCEFCAHPCGRVAAYDLAELSEDEPAIRSLKGEILANVKKAAAPAWSAANNGLVDEELCRGFYEALYAVGIFFNKEKLKPALQKSESLLKACLALEKRALQKTADERFMREALRQAKKAGEIGEVPIGCVIVRDGQIISRGYNRRTTDKNVLAHAEIMAIGKACKKIGDWRLSDCTLYVTLEPCPMCAGAMVQSRLGKCVIGSMSDKSGCAGSIINLLQEKGFNHQVEIETGVLRDECAEILSRFFEEMRNAGK